MKEVQGSATNSLFTPSHLYAEINAPCQRDYVNTLQQELGGTKAYELQTLAEERSVLNDHICHSATKFAVLLYVLLKAKTSFLRYICCLNFIKDRTKHGLLQIQALVPQLNFLNYKLHILQP